MGLKVITKPKVEIAPDLLSQLRTQTEEEGQVVLHFMYRAAMSDDSAIRIWPSTYLFDCDSDHRSEMVHVENITLYPEWMSCRPLSNTHFTLIFTGLPKSCTHFDFEEFCDGSGGEFAAYGIKRNSSDVYFLKID